MTQFILDIHGRKPLTGELKLESSLPPPSSNQSLFQFKPASNPREAAQRDAIKTGQRSVGYPDIIPLDTGGGSRVILTREWQLYIAAINPHMPKNKVAGMLGNGVAFTNGTGFNGVPRQNWLTNENLKALQFPMFDKVRTCSYACHTGTIEGNLLRLTMLDGNLPPPNIAEVNPLSHPHFFFHATIVWVDQNGVELSRKPFINKRAIAPEWGYNFEVTLMPLVSNYPILVPLSIVQPVSEYKLPYLNYP